MYGDIAWVCAGLIVTVTFAAAAAGVAPGEEFAPPPQPVDISGKASTRMSNPPLPQWGSRLRRAELRTEEAHAPILKLQSVLESLEPRLQARFLPSINQRTLRFCH